MMFGCPETLYGTNEKIGELVSSRVWLPWKISMLVPRSVAANGYGTLHSFDANSSFERPATISRPLAKPRSMMVWVRGFWRAPGVAAGGFGSVTLVNVVFARSTT